MTNEIRKQILDIDLDENTSTEKLLSLFYTDNFGNFNIHIQYWSTELLKRKLIYSSIEAEKILTSLTKNSEIINSFNCNATFHELLLKLLNVLVDESTVKNDNSKQLAHQLLCSELDLETSLLWSTFRNPTFDTEHCLCNTVKCLQKILTFIDEINLKTIDKCLVVVFESYHSYLQIARCFAYEYLKFHLFIIDLIDEKYSQTWNIFKNLIDNNILLKLYSNYFHTARDFGGNKLSLPNESLFSSIEFQYDCPLIRVYVLLILKYQSKIYNVQSYELIVRHLNLLMSKKITLETNSTSQTFPVEWLIDVFISEDSELFELLYQILLLYGAKQPETDQLIHRLFLQFIQSINYDASVLLEMLCTEDTTATTVLQFLLVYLKISPFQQKQSIPSWMKPIVLALTELMTKIQKLNDKNLFPYNPKPLLRLLNNL